MPVYLARSDWGKGGREEGYDQMMLPIVIFVVIDKLVLRRRKHERRGLLSDLHSLRSKPEKGK
jgi:hypothetical protein